jgi:hypothetical protein
MSETLPDQIPTPADAPAKPEPDKKAAKAERSSRRATLIDELTQLDANAKQELWSRLTAIHAQRLPADTSLHLTAYHLDAALAKA